MKGNTSLGEEPDVIQCCCFSTRPAGWWRTPFQMAFTARIVARLRPFGVICTGTAYVNSLESANKKPATTARKNTSVPLLSPIDIPRPGLGAKSRATTARLVCCVLALADRMRHGCRRVGAISLLRHPSVGVFHRRDLGYVTSKSLLWCTSNKVRLGTSLNTYISP